MLAFDREAIFDPAHSEEFLAALPARPAVMLIEPRAELAKGRPLLLRTADLRRRLRLLLSPPDPDSKRVNLREYAGRVRFRLTGSPFEQTLTQWQHARALWPRQYRHRLRMRPPAVVKLNLAHPYPRACVTRRVGVSGFYFGPFPSRRFAEGFLQPFLDLYKVRRCQIKIRRDPSFPGCIYSEMKMCLAPCFAGCTDQEYAAEVARVANFLQTRGAALTEELAQARESASAELDFERAATLHKRIEKAEAVRHSLPEMARPIEKLNAVVLQRAAEESCVAVFAVRRGIVSDPLLLQFGPMAGQPRTAEQILREILEPGAPPQSAPNAGSEQEDHLALLARWFYGKPREGEIFFEEPTPVGWPYRRILRACSRLLAPPEPASV